MFKEIAEQYFAEANALREDLPVPVKRPAVFVIKSPLYTSRDGH